MTARAHVGTTRILGTVHVCSSGVLRTLELWQTGLVLRRNNFALLSSCAEKVLLGKSRAPSADIPAGAARTTSRSTLARTEPSRLIGLKCSYSCIGVYGVQLYALPTEAPARGPSGPYNTRHTPTLYIPLRASATTIPAPDPGLSFCASPLHSLNSCTAVPLWPSRAAAVSQCGVCAERLSRARDGTRHRQISLRDHRASCNQPACAREKLHHPATFASSAAHHATRTPRSTMSSTRCIHTWCFAVSIPPLRRLTPASDRYTDTTPQTTHGTINMPRVPVCGMCAPLHVCAQAELA